MSTITVKKLEVNLLVPDFQQVSGDMGQKWINGLTSNVSLINDRRNAKVPDDGTYIAKVAGPSNAGFIPMIDSGFVSRRGRDADEIKAAHAKNGQGSFEKWRDNLDLAFATVDGVVGKNYVNNVANKVTNIERALGNKTLRLTGDKIRGRGPAAILPELLCGYAPAAGWLRTGDTWLGGKPYKIVLPGLEGAFKAGLAGLITRCGLTIIQNNFLAATILAQNTHLADFLDAIKDPTVSDDFVPVPAGGSSSCVFVVTDNVLTLNTLITLTA